MKFLPLLTGIIATSLFLTACGKKDEVEVLPGITKDMMPAEMPSEMPPEMPPMPTAEEYEKQQLKSYCIDAAKLGWDTKGKCPEPEKGN